HSALLVAHLESPNLSPRAPKEVPLGCALIGSFSGTTGCIGLVLTGPKTAGYNSYINNSDRCGSGVVPGIDKYPTD
ncbi:MAG: hypothetical protein N0C82_20415, partial [Candidatus Thiodiazotropha endolucinida]|nr:hypothetical protein [Candidatus Thiodiazotropha taylori]MCW4297669.1 hypothetical protein [Candidatus Thiodiazotropha endolucinida]